MSNELRFIKWVRFFERNCIVKWVIFFGSFCWLWDFLLNNLKLWWCPLERVDEYTKVVCSKKYFQKNAFKYEILNNLYFGPIFYFLGTDLSTSASHVGQHFYSPPSPSPPPHPHHKKASYGPIAVFYADNLSKFIYLDLSLVNALFCFLNFIYSITAMNNNNVSIRWIQ